MMIMSQKFNQHFHNLDCWNWGESTRDKTIAEKKERHLQHR